MEHEARSLRSAGHWPDGISGSGILEPTFGLGWAEVEGEGMDGIKPSREESQGREMEKRGVGKI